MEKFFSLFFAEEKFFYESLTWNYAEFSYDFSVAINFSVKPLNYLHFISCLSCENYFDVERFVCCLVSRSDVDKSNWKFMKMLTVQLNSFANKTSIWGFCCENCYKWVFDPLNCQTLPFSKWKLSVMRRLA